MKVSDGDKGKEWKMKDEGYSEDLRGETKNLPVRVEEKI